MALHVAADSGAVEDIERGEQGSASAARSDPTAIHWGDVDDNSCSHDESLNCFGRFGNRSNESDH
jgi:hypothetical protein